MPIDSKPTLTVAAAFAAAVLAAPASHANTAVATEPITVGSRSEIAPVPSPAALQRLEETAQLAWWWWPMMPPKFVDVWPEVTHVETIRTT